MRDLRDDRRPPAGFSGIHPRPHRCAARGLLACLLLLGACPRSMPPAAPGLPPAPTSDLREATVFIVKPDASVVEVEVLRGGVLARLGHNHVLSSRALTGQVWLYSHFPRSGFDLSLPVAEWIVDDPQSRRAAGEDFPPIPQADRDATRKNMLGPAVLDADRHPFIRLRAAGIEGRPPSVRVVVRITIKGIARDVKVAVKTNIDGAHLAASGEFDLLQSDFGIKPFRTALGALTVEDRLHVRFRIVAEIRERPAPPGSTPGQVPAPR